jgi:hypothetical protein
MTLRPLPLFAVPLAATLMVQTVGVHVSQTIPVIAPVMTSDLGIAPERVGNLASLTALGAILFLLFGTPFVAALGAALLLRWGLLAAAAAMALAGLLAAPRRALGGRAASRLPLRFHRGGMNGVFPAEIARVSAPRSGSPSASPSRPGRAAGSRRRPRGSRSAPRAASRGRCCRTSCS